MKYFRTKEHIYKRLFVDRAIINECGHGTCDKDLNPIGEAIVKESDDLKEICDEFIYIKGNRRRIYKTYEVCPEDDHEYEDEIYAGIWTDKGLIYVAKINNEGKLVFYYE